MARSTHSPPVFRPELTERDSPMDPDQPVPSPLLDPFQSGRLALIWESVRTVNGRLAPSDPIDTEYRGSTLPVRSERLNHR